MNIIEPSADLTDILHDEVGRIVVLEFLFVFKRIVELGERHRAGFEPAVEDLLDASKMLAGNVKSDFVDPRTVVIV